MCWITVFFMITLIIILLLTISQIFTGTSSIPPPPPKKETDNINLKKEDEMVKPLNIKKRTQKKLKSTDVYRRGNKAYRVSDHSEIDMADLLLWGIIFDSLEDPDVYDAPEQSVEEVQTENIESVDSSDDSVFDNGSSSDWGSSSSSDSFGSDSGGFDDGGSFD